MRTAEEEKESTGGDPAGSRRPPEARAQGLGSSAERGVDVARSQESWKLRIAIDAQRRSVVSLARVVSVGAGSSQRQ